MPAPLPPLPPPVTRPAALLGAVAHPRAELLPAVAQAAGPPVLAAYAALGAAVVALALWWPLVGLLGAPALLASARSDLDGREGWVRGLARRSPARTAVLPVRATGARRQLLVVLPDDPLSPRRAGPWPAILAALFLVGLAGALAHAAGLPLGRPLVSGAGLCLGALALGLRLRGPPRPALAPEGLAAFAAATAGALAAALPPGVDAALVVPGGDGLFADGLRTLLLNHRARFAPGQTAVLAWAPDHGPLGVVPHEGRLLRRPVPLAEPVAAAGLPRVAGPSPAATALALGWPAVGLRGGLDAPDAIPAALARAAAALAERP
jgi:hypothetical protein